MSDSIAVNVTETVEAVAVSVTETVAAVAVTVAEAGTKGDKGDQGIQGIQGPPGPPGSGGGNVAVQATNPALAAPGLWIQTGLGPGGTDMTFWVEDGS